MNPRGAVLDEHLGQLHGGRDAAVPGVGVRNDGVPYGLQHTTGGVEKPDMKTMVLLKTWFPSE